MRLTGIKDSRAKRTQWHLLTDIITISLFAAIAGAKDWEDITEDLTLSFYPF
ncbi:MAG: transposase family protein [Dolichospermum sp.]